MVRIILTILENAKHAGIYLPPATDTPAFQRNLAEILGTFLSIRTGSAETKIKCNGIDEAPIIGFQFDNLHAAIADIGIKLYETD